MTAIVGRRWWVGGGLVFLAAIGALVPCLDDLGLTYDEPAYRYSQLVSAQWWEQLALARGVADLKAVFDPDALLYYWPYGRHGINFHPPLAGQLNLLAHGLLGACLGDIPARRLASAVELALTVAMLFVFLARRYGYWAGVGAAGALLLMPRVFGQALLIDTDTPGMMLWAATAFAFWKGLHEPDAARWRVAVGVLVGLGFVEKMSTIFVLLPLLAWLVLGHLRPPTLRRGWADWLDGLLTSVLLLAPLAVAFREVLRLKAQFPPPATTDLFLVRPPTRLSGWVLLVPLGFWLSRRALARLRPSSRVWGAERPALEIWQAILAFAPAIGWLGNPAWWREALPRLAHYYMLNTDRRGSLTEIRIQFWGETYEYALPWNNGWVWIAIAVPASLLVAATLGLLFTSWSWSRRDRLPLFFVVNFLALPILRMLPTPAHDGVRLMLPTFVFLAGLAGWGIAWLGDGLAGRLPRAVGPLVRGIVLVAALGPAAWQLVKVHPYELSYYNEWIGGPRAAWDQGFELTYWYDALTPAVLRDLNKRLPAGAQITFSSELSAPAMVVSDLQALGRLRGDLRLSPGRDRFPYMWLLTHDSKAEAFTKLLFQMRPWYGSTPTELEGARVLTVAGPVAVSRAWALKTLTVLNEGRRPKLEAPPEWARRWVPGIEGLWAIRPTLAERAVLNRRVFEWAQDEPDRFIAAAEALANGEDNDRDARALRALLSSSEKALSTLLEVRPEALAEAAWVLTRRHDDVRRVLERPGFLAPEHLGTTLDEGLPDP